MISLTFKNIQHAIASFFKMIPSESVKVENVLDKIEGDKTVVEGISGAVANAVAPGAGVAVVTVEDAAFSILGAVDAALKAGGDAAAQKFIDAGVDVTAINNVKAVGAASQSFYTLVKSAA